MSRRSYARDRRRRRRACRPDVERCEGRTLLSSGLGGLTAAGPPDTIPPTAAADPTLTTLASFNGANGYEPLAGLVRDPRGDLFGTTSGGGANIRGTVFELAAGSGTLTTLASFDGANGANPHGNLVRDPRGDLFGTTEFGGANNDGTVFELAAGSGTLTTLATFDGANGAVPLAGLVRDPRGDLFGTTQEGGANNDGTVFELAAGSGTLTTLATFNGGNGALPEAGLMRDPRGDLFGTTNNGGANGDGTVFELAAGSGTITTLASFNGANGTYPGGDLVRDPRGDLFGRTEFGGADNRGTVFELAAGSGTITTLATFNGTNGVGPIGGLVRDPRGDLFGTTSGGGANNDGTVFELAAGSGTLTTLATFDGANGSEPSAGLVRDPRGDLFGTTVVGGANGAGTVFELAAGSGTVTTADVPQA